MGDLLSFKKKYPDSHEGYIDKFRDILKRDDAPAHLGYLIGHLTSELRSLPERDELFERLVVSCLKSSNGTLTRKIIDCVLEGKDPQQILKGGAE